MYILIPHSRIYAHSIPENVIAFFASPMVDRLFSLQYNAGNPTACAGKYACFIQVCITELPIFSHRRNPVCVD
jgi:hypothetical protein